jgi:hypothetical protein
LEQGNIQPTLTAQGKVRIKPKSKKELSNEYDVHPSTIAEWCTKIGIDTKGCKLSIPQLLLFYQAHGYPGDYQVGLSFEK